MVSACRSGSGWLSTQGLRNLALDSLDSLRGLGVVRADFIDRLIREYLPQHPGYYGELVWILMMLSQWLQSKPHRRSILS